MRFILQSPLTFIEGLQVTFSHVWIEKYGWVMELEKSGEKKDKERNII